MPANTPPGDTAFPVRGTPGGYRDPWDEPDEATIERGRIEEEQRRLIAHGLVLAAVLRAEEGEERKRRGHVG